jgi:dGTPase
MFELFMREPDVMPNQWGQRGQLLGEAERARLVCDYIAGMTDRFAIEEHKKLFQLDVIGS